MTLDPLIAQLRMRRRQLRLGQRTVVRAMGYASPSTLSYCERGQRSPSLDLVRRWADALGCVLVLVPLDEDGELDHDPEPPGELLTHAQRRERLIKLARTDMRASEIAQRLNVSERSVHRRRAKQRDEGES